LCNKGPLKLVKSFGKSFAKKQKKNFHHIFEAVSPFGDFFCQKYKISDKLYNFNP
jgi:hypothetical protein